jgi:hypothetical protein
MIPLSALAGIVTCAKQMVDMYEEQKTKHNDELAPIDQLDMVDARTKMKELKAMLNKVDLEEE